jgi:putative ABC transport system permease protein
VKGQVDGDDVWNGVLEGMDGEYTYRSAYVSSRAANAEEVYAMDGGFFFMGLYLGALFLMATVLIIYYKQLSEGYEDAGSFRIMQRLGMSQAEVRGSIHSQIMIVFFLPLLAAAVHIAFAFNMIVKMLYVFSLSNTGLFAVCTLGTLLVFAAIYAFVYAVTARAYYRIVRI